MCKNYVFTLQNNKWTRRLHNTQENGGKWNLVSFFTKGKIAIRKSQSRRKQALNFHHIIEIVHKGSSFFHWVKQSSVDNGHSDLVGPFFISILMLLPSCCLVLFANFGLLFMIPTIFEICRELTIQTKAE